MSVFDENIHPATPERQIDLLVDGELSEADRRAVALAVGARARRMAALCPGVSGSPVLEGGIGSDCPAGGGAEPARRKPSRSIRQARAESGGGKAGASMRRRSLTIAASFLIALVVGMGLRGNWSGGLHSPDRRR